MSTRMMGPMIIGFVVVWITVAIAYQAGVDNGVRQERESRGGEPGCEVREEFQFTCTEGEPPLVRGVERPYLLCTWRSPVDYRVQAQQGGQGFQAPSRKTQGSNGVGL